jgi:hypothetical protein
VYPLAEPTCRVVLIVKGHEALRCVVDDCVDEPVAAAFAQNTSASSALPMKSISAMSDNVILEWCRDIIVNPARITALLSLQTSGARRSSIVRPDPVNPTNDTDPTNYRIPRFRRHRMTELIQRGVTTIQLHISDSIDGKDADGDLPEIGPAVAHKG